MQTEDFVRTSNEATTSEKLFRCYENAMEMIGFDSVIFSLMTDHPTLKKEATHGIIRNYSEHWMDYYTDNSYEDIDPVRQNMFVSGYAFRWGDLLSSDGITDDQTRMMFEGKESGLNSGIGVPLRCAHGALAGIGAASSDKSLKVTDYMLCYSNMLSHHFYKCYLSIMEDSKLAEKIPVNLTQKEKDVLYLCANGEKRRNISSRLHISTHTVDFHIRNIQRKLSARNITEASVKAVSRGLIQI